MKKTKMVVPSVELSQTNVLPGNVLKKMSNFSPIESPFSSKRSKK
jgi:hypothetical protein